MKRHPAHEMVLAKGKLLLDRGEIQSALIVLKQGLLLPDMQQNPVFVVNLLGMLAACHKRLMRFDDAESIYNRAFQIAEALEPDHVVRVAIMYSWAALERSRGALEREKRLWLMLEPLLNKNARYHDWLAECQRSLKELETLRPIELRLRDSFQLARAAEHAGTYGIEKQFALFKEVGNRAQELATHLKQMGRHRECGSILRDGFIMQPEELWRKLTAINSLGLHQVLQEQRCRFNLFPLQGLGGCPTLAPTPLCAGSDSCISHAAS